MRGSQNWLWLLFLAQTLFAQQPMPVDETSPFPNLSFFSGHLKIGGWVDFLYQDGNRENSEAFTDVQHVYLDFLVSFSDHWRFFVETEYRRMPSLTETPLEREFEWERAFLEYRRDQSLRFRLGKFNTPAGIWKPIHWAILVDTIQRPIMEDNDYIPTNSNGLEMLGHRFSGRGEWKYALLYSTETGEDRERPEADSNAFGGDVNFTYLERYILGVSYYNYKDVRGINGSVNGILTYADIHLWRNYLLLRSEFLTLTRTESPDIKAFYVKLKYQFTKTAYFNYRFDRADDEENAGGQERIIETATIGYWPNSFLRFKLEFAEHDLEFDPGFEQYAIWMGVIF